MRKPLNLKTVPALLKDMKDLGFETLGFFMIGFPEETREEIEETINGAVKLKAAGLDYASFFIVNPLPGTEIYYQCLQKGYIDENLDLTKANYGKGLITTPEFDPAYLSKMRHSAWIKINFSLNTDFILYPEETRKALEKIQSLKQKTALRFFLCADAPELEQELRKIGCQLSTFSDGQSLLDALEKTIPDYILIENDLKVISGWNVLRKIRKGNLFKDIPVLLIVKNNKEKIKGKDISWYIQEVLDKKESYA
jgi:CheY-like chemotaxis protein